MTQVAGDCGAKMQGCISGDRESKWTRAGLSHNSSGWSVSLASVFYETLSK